MYMGMDNMYVIYIILLFVIVRSFGFCWFCFGFFEVEKYFVVSVGIEVKDLIFWYIKLF